MCSNKVSTLWLLSNGVRSIFDVLISLTGHFIHAGLFNYYGKELTKAGLFCMSVPMKNS